MSQSYPWKEITSLQHPIIKHAAALVKERSYRYSQHSVIIEGKKMVQEAAAYGHLKKLFATADLQKECSQLHAGEKYLITEAIAHKVTHLQKADGIFAEVQMPAFKTVLGLNRVLILEETNDPGNLGALIRTALALGWEGILLIGNCCDPFNDKALRAAKGATFRMPIQQSSWSDMLALLEKKNANSCCRS